MEFPADFREVVGAYGAVLVDGHLCPKRPAPRLLHDLGTSTRGSPELRREEDMSEHLPGPAGPGPGNAMPVATATTGGSVFLRVPDDAGSPWRVGTQEVDGPAWTLYGTTFGEWLPACLRGRT
ncbi:SMI1/KNR4 family protein [Streptomyces roseolus]|uniref:SMI1/KNR4 family protein n=1 Tax=Streptomyces roseolus TaxID=67358 RepID=UPI003787E70F